MKVSTVLRLAVLSTALLGAVSAHRSGATICDSQFPADTVSSTGSAPAATTEAPVVTTAAPAETTAAPATDATTQTTTDTTTSSTGDDDSTTDSAYQSEVNGEADTTEASAAATSTTSSGATQSAAGSVTNAFSYTGDNCGGPGSYDMVTDVSTCSTSTHVTTNAVSPFDGDVTMVFRGPMTIHNIAVFTGSNDVWSKVSSYAYGGEATNMVFLNNNNIDYTGASSPEGYATSDGNGVADEPTPFAGDLAAATSPGGTSIYAYESTGSEVHIMTSAKCGDDAECDGYYDTDGTAHLGWTGSKKIFITTVEMPHDGDYDLPAIWMLNGQVVRSNQYSCNCRGSGAAGGCGELDIAEVLEKDKTVCATHYYFYDGTFSPGSDTFSTRPSDCKTTYVTIIDEDYGIKVVEIGGDDFDYSSSSIANDVVTQWESA